MDMFGNGWLKGGEEIYSGASRSFRANRKGIMDGDITLTSASQLIDAKSRSRHIIANNSYAATAKQRYKSNVIGTGFSIQFKDNFLQEKWEEFAEQPMAVAGISLNALLSYLAGDVFEEGEAFIRKLVGKNDSALRLQWISPIRCDITKLDSVENTIQGVRFADDGSLRSYWMWKRSPFGCAQFGNDLLEIPAEEIIHCFGRERADQVRGIPALTPSLLALYEVDELQDATLVRQKAAQAIGWIIEKSDPMELPAIGQVLSPELLGMKEEGMLPLQAVRAGGIHYLRKGEKAVFATIPDIGGNLLGLMEMQLAAIAACSFTTREELTGDLSKVNFSSIRAGLIASRRVLEQHQQFLFLAQIITPIVWTFMRRLALMSGKPRLADKKNFPTITPPKWIWVDQLGETKSDVMEIEAGLKTLEMALAERGLTVQQYVESKKRSEAAEQAILSSPIRKAEDSLEKAKVNKVETKPSEEKKDPTTAEEAVDYSAT